MIALLKKKPACALLCPGFQKQVSAEQKLDFTLLVTVDPAKGLEAQMTLLESRIKHSEAQVRAAEGKAAEATTAQDESSRDSWRNEKLQLRDEELQLRNQLGRKEELLQSGKVKLNLCPHIERTDFQTGPQDNTCSEKDYLYPVHWPIVMCDL